VCYLWEDVEGGEVRRETLMEMLDEAERILKVIVVGNNYSDHLIRTDPIKTKVIALMVTFANKKSSERAM
jgi:hypothetical protein